MIGTTAALIMGGLAAGSHLAGAKMQSNAAKNAAKTQQQAGQQSLALQQRGYEDAKANLSPWMAQGQSALQSISGRLGLPGNTGPTPVGASQTPAAEARQPMRVPPRQAGDNGSLANRLSLGAFARPTSADGGGTVMLRAPTGETMAVPAAQADHYLAKGAMRA